MSADVIQAAKRFRVVPALQPIESAKPSAYQTLILGPDISVGELMRALRASDIVLHSVGPFLFLTRNPSPPSPDAA